MKRTAKEIGEMGRSPDANVRAGTYAWLLQPIGRGKDVWVPADEIPTLNEGETANYNMYKIGLDKAQPYSKGGPWKVYREL